MARLYSLEDFTVCSWDGDASLLNFIGSATERGESAERTNDALKDEWEHAKPGRKSRTIDLDVAADSDCSIDFKGAWEAGSLVRLVLTDSAGDTTDANFCVMSVEKSTDEAIRYRVTLKQYGDPN